MVVCPTDVIFSLRCLCPLHQTQILKNYRGIVVLPIICKLLEHIARTNFRTILTEKQSPLQRGFTTNISPLNAAIIIEEVYKEYSDKKAPFYIALLDAKSAFDVVD
jgi:hypothetical protein